MHFYGEGVVAMDSYRKGAKRGDHAVAGSSSSNSLTRALTGSGKTAEAQKADGKPEMSEVLADYNAFKDLWSAESSYLVRNQD